MTDKKYTIELNEEQLILINRVICYVSANKNLDMLDAVNLFKIQKDVMHNLIKAIHDNEKFDGVL